jgi:hypothetical protein
MRPIPWILAALVCTAIGVVFTGEGLSSKKPNPLRPSRRGPAAGPSAAAAAAGLVDSATDPAASAMGDVTELPEGFLPPSSAEAELLVPDPGMCVIVVKSADEILFRPPQQPGDLRLSESQIEALEGLVQSMREKQGLPPQEDLRAALLEAARKPVAEWPRPISELDETLVAMRTALASDAADAKLSVLLAFEGHALWSLVRPVLEACGKAGLEEVRFAVLRPNETVGSLTYALFEAPDGTFTPTLEARGDERSEGGVLLLRVGRVATFFEYRGEKGKRAAQFKDAIAAFHTENADFNGPAYAKDGKAWTIRAAEEATLTGLIEAMTVLIQAEIPRFGIEVKAE